MGPPAAGMTYTSALPAWLELKAMDRPSGE